jgi:hypothetical protein
MSDQETTPAPKADVTVNVPRMLYKDKNLQLIEYQPQTRMIKFCLNGRHERRFMSFPYVQMGRYDHSGGGNKRVSLHVSFKNTPMKSMDDQVYLPLLPNCWSGSLQVCIYPSQADFRHFIDLFFGASFTSTEQYVGWNALDKATFVDIAGVHQVLGPAGCKDTAYKMWDRYTKADPNFSLRVNWPEVGGVKESWKNVNAKMQIRNFAVYPKNSN